MPMSLPNSLMSLVTLIDVMTLMGLMTLIDMMNLMLLRKTERN